LAPFSHPVKVISFKTPNTFEVCNTITRQFFQNVSDVIVSIFGLALRVLQPSGNMLLQNRKYSLIFIESKENKNNFVLLRNVILLWGNLQ
jgi:hypothetical protein